MPTGKRPEKAQKKASHQAPELTPGEVLRAAKPARVELPGLASSDVPRAAGEASGEPQDAMPSDVVRAAKRGRDVAELVDQLCMLRQQMADFEAKYGQSFEEFQGRLEPEAEHEVQSDYLSWSRLAEQYRIVLSRLQRLLASSRSLEYMGRGRKRA